MPLHETFHKVRALKVAHKPGSFSKAIQIGLDEVPQLGAGHGKIPF